VSRSEIHTSAIADYWINDRSGDPLFVVTRSTQP
jgi:hypothetical protein